jgi:hypothetical protein
MMRFGTQHSQPTMFNAMIGDKPGTISSGI